MKKLPRITSLSLGLILGLIQLLPVLVPVKANALTGSDFNPGRIIDDSVFFNPNTMSSQEIQNFLNAKVPICDTNHAPAGGYSPPYICLKDFSMEVPARAPDIYCSGGISAGKKSAATIIKEVAAACSISPQIILILLQKEQSLITDDWPWPIQYEKATGFACPDTAACDSQYAGFFNQVYYGARQYQRYAKEASRFNHRAGQTSYIQYNPNASCGGTNIFIQNQATAGLYNYTPYQPNAAALGNLGGTGDSCSAYGNRNFWKMYWNWFGNPIGSRYAWLIDSFTYSGGDNLLAQGYTETLTLKARNVGRSPWYNHGSNPVRLGGWQPAERNSTFLGGNRIANLQETVVQPNELGTFSFQVTPKSQGSFVESLNLVSENNEWMQWPGFSPTFNVTSPYQWQIQDVLYEKGTGVMEPGSKQLITVKAKNNSNFTWNKASSSPVRLGTWQPERRSGVSQTWMSPTRVTDMNETSVAPGQIAGFQFYVTMPASGNFYERLNLVSEGQAWFHDPGLTLYLYGQKYAWEPVWHTLSTPSANIPKNTEFTITFKAKNTGEVAWNKTAGFPVRLATVAPQNRGSVLEHSTWLNSVRPAGLSEDVVLPGQIGTFTFKARTPSTAGARMERFSLVAEGITWLNDPGYSIYINTQ